jgi:thioredoxin 1
MMQALLYMLGGAAALLLVFQIAVSLRARKQRVREVGHFQGAIGEAIRGGERVLAYFYSPVCAACKLQTPIVNKLASEYEHVYTIDITQDFEIAHGIGVQVTPTIVIIEGGEIRDFLVGARTEDMLREALL